MSEKKEEKKPKGNVVLEKFKKEQSRENKQKKWDKVDDAVRVARNAYTGGFEPNSDEKTVSFERALGDLIEVLEKIKDGEIKLGGLGENESGVELPKLEAEEE
jgi:hypothetical protein